MSGRSASPKDAERASQRADLYERIDREADRARHQYDRVHALPPAPDRAGSSASAHLATRGYNGDAHDGDDVGRNPRPRSSSREAAPLESEVRAASRELEARERFAQLEWEREREAARRYEERRRDESGALRGAREATGVVR